MNTQPSLFDSFAPPGVPEDVAVQFLKYARSVKSAGFRKYSAKTICERIRWHERVDRGNRDFKLNNNWTASLARWAMGTDATLRGFFETRERKGGH